MTIDVDYYTSTLESLSWLDRFIASGALIYFDDMWAFHGHPEYGQIRAMREFHSHNTNGLLIPFDTYGEAGKCFIYCRKAFEYLKAFVRRQNSRSCSLWLVKSER